MYKGAQGGKLIFSGGINHPIPITITKSFGKRNRKRWSNKVTKKSHAMDLEDKVFTKSSPKSMARSIKRSVESSKRLKAGPYKSGISMFSFYINRAGKKLSSKRKKTIMKAKDEFRKLYSQTTRKRRSRRSRKIRRSHT